MGAMKEEEQRERTPGMNGGCGCLFSNLPNRTEGTRGQYPERFSRRVFLASSGNGRESRVVLCQISICASSEGSSAGDELVRVDPKPPAVDLVRVASPDEDFGSHVGHRSRHTGQYPSFRIMNDGIEIGQVGIPLVIQKDIIGFDVPALAGRCLKG